MLTIKFYMKLIFTIAILFTIASNSYASKGKGGNWEIAKGSSDKEIIAKLQERILFLDKRDEVIRKALNAHSDKIYDIECTYLRLPGTCR
jgi:hypothetical protein